MIFESVLDFPVLINFEEFAICFELEPGCKFNFQK